VNRETWLEAGHDEAMKAERDDCQGSHGLDTPGAGSMCGWLKRVSNIDIA